MVVHHGTNRWTLKRTPCGVLKTDAEYSVNVQAVNCITCIEQILKNRGYDTGKTPLWEARLNELKDIRDITKAIQQKLI